MTIFADTNSLLHYPQLKDVDWGKVADADEVKIVICMEVVRELDAKKSDNRLSSRADRVIKEIRSLRAANGRIRDHVRLEIFNQLIADDKGIVSGDEKIIYELKAFAQEHNDANVAIYTEDLGMVLRCETHGITCIEPDKATRLENPQSEIEKKYKQAVIELNTLKNLQPRIDVELSDKSGVSPLKINVKKTALANIEEDVSSERLDLGLPDSEDAVRMRDQFDIGLLSPTKEDRDQYEKECERYLAIYRNWLEKKNALQESEAMEFAFKIVVTNSGTTIGEDVNVRLTFPPILQFMDGGRNNIKGRRIRVPEEPMRPKKPQPAYQKGFLPHEDMVAQIKAQMVKLELPFVPRAVLESPAAPSWSLDGDASDGFRIEVLLSRINHHTSRRFGLFRSAFQKWEDAKPFQIDLEIIAANMIEKVEAKIPVMVHLEE